MTCLPTDQINMVLLTAVTCGSILIVIAFCWFYTEVEKSRKG